MTFIQFDFTKNSAISNYDFAIFKTNFVNFICFQDSIVNKEFFFKFRCLNF